ncbi:MAG: hypothetical protein JW849_00745 [Phycisphaerae bacterium]|nr:hypothetical protein [Phycisphaerae bacterium]
MKRLWIKLSADQAGQMTVEWSLLVAAFGLPMIYLFSVLLAALAEHYRMVTLVLSLPFP